jgi:hypothetical protein
MGMKMLFKPKSLLQAWTIKTKKAMAITAKFSII